MYGYFMQTFDIRV